jgi:hypothetical protein
MRQSVRISRRQFLLATTAEIAATPALVAAVSLQDGPKFKKARDQIEAPMLEDLMKGKVSFDFLRQAPIKVGAVTSSPTKGRLVRTEKGSEN